MGLFSDIGDLFKSAFDDVKNTVSILKNAEDLGPTFKAFKYGEEGYARVGYTADSSHKLNKHTDIFHQMDAAIRNPDYYIYRKTGTEFANDTLKFASSAGFEDEAYNNLTRKILRDTDFFVKMDADDNFMRSVLNKANDAEFQQQYLRSEYDAGKFNKKYGYSAKTYDDLTDAQKIRLATDYQKGLDFVNFQYANGMEEAGKTYRRGLITKQLGDTESASFAKQQKRELKRAKKIGFGEEKQAYQDYVKKTYEEGGTLLSEKDFYKQTYGYDTKELNTMMKDMRNAKAISSGNPDHSGIGLWDKAVNNPVIATGIVLGGIYGVTELTEEDGF